MKSKPLKAKSRQGCYTRDHFEAQGIAQNIKPWKGFQKVCEENHYNP